MPSTADKAAAWSRLSVSMPSSIACHQACGSCSLCPGDGRCTDSGTVALPTTCCASSTSSALTAEVPKSRPRNSALVLRRSGGQRTPAEMRQGLTGLVEYMAGGRIDREADLLVGAHRIATFDLHRHLLIAVGLDVQ